MSMICERCGGPIARQVGAGGKRKRCATCSPSRDRPDRKPRRQKVTPTAVSGTTASTTASGVLEATRRELEAAGVSESVAGACALVLAAAIDSGEDSGSGLASLVRAHREAMGAALALAPREEDPLARLRRRRQEPLGSA